MKYLRLLFKNLLRNKRRTFLTMSSIAVSLFLIATLQTLLHALTNPPETPDSALRLVVRHRISLFNTLPAAYRQKIEKVPGVESVVGSMWYGGIYKDPSNFFANFSVDTDQFFQVYPDLEMPKDQKEAFVKDRMGAIAGKNLADRFGWKVGDRFFLKSNTWPIDGVEVTLRGIYEGGSDDASSFYFHWDYWNELMKQQYGEWDQTGTFSVRVQSADDVGRVAEQIDTLFRNSNYPTKTETEKAFVLSFVSMLGDVQTFITSIISVVVFAIILIAANTMAMSIRERSREIGVLKAIGFRSRQVLGLLIGESVALALGGALIGTLAARLIYHALPLAQMTSGFVQSLDVTAGIILSCSGIGAVVGLVSAGLPAWQASRKPVVEALRRVV
jgi:putative ABC transport system permease protein